MRRRPESITVIASVAPDRLDHARAWLDAHANSGPTPLAFDEVGGLHFARILLIDDPTAAGDAMRHSAGDGPARLVLSFVYDGTFNEHATRLEHALGDAFAELLSCCIGFTGHLASWLGDRARRPQTYHVGAVGRTVDDIRADDRLREAIEAFIDEQSVDVSFRDRSAREIRDRIRAHVSERRDLPQHTPAREALQPLRRLADMILTCGGFFAPFTVLAVLVFPAAWPVATPIITLIAFGIAFLVLRLYEHIEPDIVVRPEPAHVERLLSDEDHRVQNHLTMVASTRPSLLRRALLAFTLWAGNTLSRLMWNGGRLAGVDTIHFARIHQFDRGRTMLFLSDYDGSWQRYLGDFLTTGAFAVVPIWANLRGCPKTTWLFRPTAGFAERFLAFTRARQVLAPIWYSAYAHLTVANIQNNARIRDGLFEERSDEELRQWLSWI